jgi:hypothetical protein
MGNITNDLGLLYRHSEKEFPYRNLPVFKTWRVYLKAKIFFKGYFYKFQVP